IAAPCRAVFVTLRIEHVQVRRGRSRVLEPGGITASAPAAIGVVGINGSGKSSLFMHLADVLLASRSGSSIRIDGRPASVAYVPQHPALPGWLTPREVARVYGL